MNMRIEEDLLGKLEVPEEAYYGIHTLRAVQNFPISGRRVQDVPEMVRAMAQVKKAASLANEELHVLPHDVAQAIQAGCDQILEHGRGFDQFPVDLFQGGAGTSVNMNTNEVVANFALEKLGYEKGRYDLINPNDDVNKSQSTNDAYPTGLRLAFYALVQKLRANLSDLVDAFEAKGNQFSDVIKMGRTQLQDAVPMTLGQEFAGFGHNLAEELGGVQRAAENLLLVNLGATAIGTGLNTPDGYSEAAAKHLSEVTGLQIQTAPDLVEATSDNGDYVQLHCALKRLAYKLSKICNDLRLLSSGPRAGLDEINLPELQAGSSIMPAKVNPVIPEVVNQVCFKVMGNDGTVTMAAEAGQLQLNVMEPVMAEVMFESLNLLTNAIEVLREKCIEGITANEDVCRSYVLKSIGIVTCLNEHIGHKNGDLVGRECARTGKSVKDVVVEMGFMTEQKVDACLAQEALLAGEYTGKVWADDEHGLPA